MSAKAILDLLQNLVSAKKSARSELERLRVQIAEKESTRKKLLDAPLSRADLEAAMLSHVAGLHWRAAHEDMEIAGLLDEQRRRPQALIQDPATAAPYDPLPSKWDASLFHLFLEPAAVVAALEPVFNRIDFAGAGLPIAERRVRLAELDGELVAMRKQEGEFADLLRTAETDPEVDSLRRDLAYYQDNERHVYDATS